MAYARVEFAIYVIDIGDDNLAWTFFDVFDSSE